MAHGIIKIITFTVKGGMIGFTLGLAGAGFGTVIGSSFSDIWASGMPMAMGCMGAAIFGMLSTIGMHRRFGDDFRDRELYTGD